MHLLARYLILCCAVLVVVRWADAADDQFTARILIECERGAPRLNCLVYHSDGKTYVAGSLGRVGWFSEEKNTYVWECLTTYDELCAGCSVKDTLVFAGEGGVIWYRVKGRWNRGSSPTTSRITSIARGEGQWHIATLDGDVYTSTALLNAPWQNVVRDPQIRWFGIATHDANVVAVGSRGSILVSTNSGVDWSIGFAPIDTLAWKCVHWFPNDIWMVGGEGARLAITEDLFESEPSIEALFPPYTSNTYPEYHPDAINFIQTLNDGGAVVGGFDNMRGYPQDRVDNEAIFTSHEPFSSWNSHRMIEYSSRLLSAVNCIGVRDDGSEIRAFTSCNTGTTTLNGIFRGELSSEYLYRSAIHSVSTFHRVDEPWLLYYRENAAVTPIDNHSMIVARNHLKVLFYGDPTPEPVLLRYTWNDNSFWIDSIATAPATVYSLLANGSDLFVGTTLGYVFVSADRGKSWNGWVIPDYGPLVELMEGNRNRLVVVAGMLTLHIGRWDTKYLTVTTDQGGTWRIIEPDVCATCHAVFYSMSSEANGRINVLYNEIDSSSGSTLKAEFISDVGELFLYPALPTEMSSNVPVEAAIDKSGTISIAGAVLDDDAQWRNAIIRYVDGQWTYQKMSFINSGVIENSEARDIVSFDRGGKLWGIVDGDGKAYFSSDSGATWNKNTLTVGGLPDTVKGIVSTATSQFVLGSSVFASVVTPTTPTSVAEAPIATSCVTGYTNRIPITTSCRPLLVQAFDVRGRLVAQKEITDASASIDPQSITRESGVFTIVVSCEQTIQFATFIFAP